MSGKQFLIALFTVILALPTLQGQAQESSTKNAITAIREVGKEGQGFDRAIPAAKQLRSLSADKIAMLLDGLADANPIAENWMRGVVFDVVRKSGSAPIKTLEDYVSDTSKNPAGRGLAMELIQKQSPKRAEKLISTFLDDSSLPLREMAVEQLINRAKKAAKNDPDSAKSQYQRALASARHPIQLSRVVESLRKLGDEDVSLGKAFVMITEWKSLAPLNNADGVGYDEAYLPEKEFAKTGSVKLDGEYKGKSGPIRWQDASATGDEGAVDLAAAYNKEKGAVSYVFTEFESENAIAALARLTSKNANKVWINGELVMENEVYHSGSTIDQYVSEFKLKKGTNRILLKLCQNEQEEPWAQDWQFQFRITDRLGKALRSSK